jgi:hypothetical protein
MFEDDAVVNTIEPSAGCDEILPYCAFISETVHDALGFDAFIFEKSEKDEAIKSTLN